MNGNLVRLHFPDKRVDLFVGHSLAGLPPTGVGVRERPSYIRRVAHTPIHQSLRFSRERYRCCASVRSPSRGCEHSRTRHPPVLNVRHRYSSAARFLNRSTQSLAVFAGVQYISRVSVQRGSPVFASNKRRENLLALTGIETPDPCAYVPR